MATVNWNGRDVVARARLGLRRGVLAAAEDVRTEAVRLIVEPPKTGRVYRRRGITHQASAPGEAPASDTGRLAGSTTVDPLVENGPRVTASITARTEYAAALEYGTPTIAPRSFLRRALMSKRDEIIATIRSAVAAALRSR